MSTPYPLTIDFTAWPLPVNFRGIIGYHLHIDRKPAAHNFFKSPWTTTRTCRSLIWSQIELGVKKIVQKWWFWTIVYMSWSVKCSSESVVRPTMLPQDRIVDGEIIVIAWTGDVLRRPRHNWSKIIKKSYDSDGHFIQFQHAFWTSASIKVVSYTIILLPCESIPHLQLASNSICVISNRKSVLFSSSSGSFLQVVFS